MSEFHEQATLFEWAALQAGAIPELDLMFATLNGAALAGGGRQWAILRRAGAKKGIPDIVLPVARGGYHGLLIELKFGSNKPTKEQAVWLDRLHDEGYMAVACWGWEDARDCVIEYLSGGKDA